MAASPRVQRLPDCVRDRPTIIRGQRRDRSRPRLMPSPLRAGGILALCGLFLVHAIGVGAQTDHLTPEQESVARAVEEKLIAPCCFRQTLAEHRSKLSETLRGELRVMITKGATEAEIVDHFLAKYGERILVTPRATGFNLLAYVMPGLALVAGLALLLLFLSHAAKGTVAGTASGRPGGSALGEFNHGLRARMTEELDRFDA